PRLRCRRPCYSLLVQACECIFCRYSQVFFSSLLFHNATAPTPTYTLSLHDALPISASGRAELCLRHKPGRRRHPRQLRPGGGLRSEEHTSELQSRFELVCRLLLEKKKDTLDYTRAEEEF